MWVITYVYYVFSSLPPENLVNTIVNPFVLVINWLSIGQMREWALQSEQLSSLAVSDCMTTNLLIITLVH